MEPSCPKTLVLRIGSPAINFLRVEGCYFTRGLLLALSLPSALIGPPDLAAGVISFTADFEPNLRISLAWDGTKPKLRRVTRIGVRHQE